MCRIPAIALLSALCLSLLACDTLQDVLTAMDKPSARVQAVRFGDLSLDAATLLFDVEISNPYSVPLPLLDADYKLASTGTAFLSGTADIGGTIPANGSRTVTLPATVAFANLLKSVQGVKLGSLVPYQADLSLAVDAPGVGRLALPISKKGELPVPNVPRVSLSSVRWDKLTLGEAAATLSIDVTNTNQFKLALQQMGYDLSLGGSKVVSSRVADAVSFSPGQAQTISVPISFSPSSLGLGVFNMLRGEGAGYGLSGSMNVQTPFGPMTLPYSSTGRTSFK